MRDLAYERLAAYRSRSASVRLQAGSAAPIAGSATDVPRRRSHAEETDEIRRTLDVYRGRVESNLALTSEERLEVEATLRVYRASMPGAPRED